MSKPAQGVFWVFMILLLALTRIHAAAQYFSIDNVNLALALEKFDPNNHQPQPPGYPFFVALSRLVNLVLNDVRTTFLVLSVVVTALCLPIAVALGKRLFNERAGQTAALLLVLNPVFWQSGLDGPLRLHLALFSLAVAYCAWRAWSGERRWVMWGALTLAAGSGFRPDLLAYLFPLWIVSAWIGTRSIRTVTSAVGIFAGMVAIWIGALIYAVGGPLRVYALALSYLSDPSTQVILWTPMAQGWMRQISRLLTWNGLAVVGWIWTVPLGWRALTRRVSLSADAAPSPGGRGLMGFLALWVIPGLFFQAVFHVAAPGHTLFSIPAFCMVGGFLIGAAAERLGRSDSSRIADLSVAAALVLNVLLFLNYYPLPSAPVSPGLLRSVKNAIAYATFETSINSVRDPDNLTGETLRELKELAPPTTPWMIVTTDGYEKNWFTNWRIVRYYLPDADIWVMADQRRPKMALRVRRNKTVGTPIGEAFDVEVPQGARILWLLEPGGTVHRELEKLQILKGGRHVFYTDIAPDVQGLQISSFRFLPVARLQ